MTSNFIQDGETPGRKCGWIRFDMGPEMGTRQEMMPHILKADLESNDAWMNECIGSGNYTIKKIIPRDPCIKTYILSRDDMKSVSDYYTCDHIEGLACQWFGEYGQDIFPVLHLVMKLIPSLRNT